jgi:hypothetical protein
VSSTNGQTGPRTLPDEPGADEEASDEPTLLSMMGLVAIVVAVVILVFFALGYLFGRVFL